MRVRTGRLEWLRSPCALPRTTPWYRLLSTRRSWLPRCHTYSGFTLTGIVASFTFVNI
jgi:hypothetical protein